MSVAVVIPVYKSHLSELEQLSLSQCALILRDYPLLLLGPRSLDYVQYLELAPSACKLSLDEEHFASVTAYSKLLLSRYFYEQFVGFEYILIHQLDAFVFRDALGEWCAQAYDYVGAPWVRDDGSLVGVGNGGLSLRNVAGCLAVLGSSHKETAHDYWAMVRLTTTCRFSRAARYHRKMKRILGLRDDVNRFLGRFICEGRPEDLFWGLHAVRFYPGFRVAPPMEAFKFSIEDGLAEFFDIYAPQAPFGCHQRRFLRMIARYLRGATKPESVYESLVWELSKKAGLVSTTRRQECDSIYRR